MRLYIQAFLVMLILTACSPKNPGFLTLVNSGVEAIKISVDGRTFTIRPSNHITKEIASGIHKIKIDSGQDIGVPIAIGKTTVLDSTGLSCYAAVDYTERYKGGVPYVIEKFKGRQVFTTKDKMLVYLGTYLPENLKENERAIRLQQIDCEAFDNDLDIVDSVSTLK